MNALTIERPTVDLICNALDNYYGDLVCVEAGSAAKETGCAGVRNQRPVLQETDQC